MTVNRAGKTPMRRKLLRATLAKLLGADHAESGAAAILATPVPDPVMIATLAIDHVGPATVRAVAIGVEVQVAAPDEATAAVFRAALADTARRRSTDRLVRIVVD
ncbi:MAG TPA: hypothetical protein VGR45_03430 [Stellaceae bacterium]|nr:hypothetical protein [Stellaceae bacterium]